MLHLMVSERFILGWPEGSGFIVFLLRVDFFEV